MSHAQSRTHQAGGGGPADGDLLSARADGSLPAGVVHDLGNLVQLALSGLNRLARDPGVSSAPALEPVIVSTRTALQSAGTLVRETIGRAREARVAGEKADVGACLSEIERLAYSAWEPTIRIAVDAASDLPLAACDRMGLQNALLNLVFNARDAMPDGGMISIQATRVASGVSTALELRVADRGIGMTNDTIARAFDPFFTTKGTGLGGVGLPMVKHFAEEHGGSVAIESTPGSGTTVTLRLPASDPEADAG